MEGSRPRRWRGHFHLIAHVLPARLQRVALLRIPSIRFDCLQSWLQSWKHRVKANGILIVPFAEARYFGWDKVEADQEFPVKGYSLSALGSSDRARTYAGGPVLLARLSPVDYHHLHYPDHGKTLKDYRLGRRLWTVNWHALQHKPNILFANERHINILQTKNFGRLGFVEIGALSVGRIVQIHPLDSAFERGAEKSAFRFGGSAVVVFGEAGAWQPSEDLLQHTREGVETLVRLGEPIAARR